MALRDQARPVIALGPSAPSYLVNDSGLNDSDKAFSVTAAKEWELYFIYCQLVTTATVGNRKMRMEILDASLALLWFKEWTPTQAASLTRHYFAGANLPDDAAFDASNRARIGFDPRGLILAPGWILRFYDVNAIDAAADDLTVRVAGVERPQ